MSFFSLRFGVFFAVTVALYFLSPGRLRVPVLLAASVVFYMSFVPQYIFLLAGLITIDYFTARLLERAEGPAIRKAWLILSLTANGAFMASFKYSPDVFGKSLGVIPLGLSFHTFQAMGYMIEVYRRRQAAERSFLVFALYILFFPQIAAGPIERPQDLLPQFREEHKFSYRNAVSGLQLMAWGLFQKSVVAALLAPFVNAVYQNPASHSGPVVLAAAICFSFQIFCDFSGYSDIAVGSAQVMGFRLTRNFNRPFQADSMAEYWKRWHISLSNWMRDYIFYPLCGRRPGIPRICASIMLVFLANGLWHGARWNYLISGFLHGSYRVTELVATRAMSRRGWSVPPFLERPARLSRMLLVFTLMTFAFVFFRGQNLPKTLLTISSLFHGWSGMASRGALMAEFAAVGVGPIRMLLFVALIGMVQAVQFLQRSVPLRLRISAQPFWLRWSFYYSAGVAFVVLAPVESLPFIYFQF